LDQSLAVFAGKLTGSRIQFESPEAETLGWDWPFHRNAPMKKLRLSLSLRIEFGLQQQNHLWMGRPRLWGIYEFHVAG
ncbi:MAG TPA: hypothetical protein VM715_17580, partial [Candidatus Acidoferrum sp.]|nr:hypothetical protein [Candidatus Acidoferrum sp.]